MHATHHTPPGIRRAAAAAAAGLNPRGTESRAELAPSAPSDEPT
jgi:hypothetical protein